MVIGRYTRRPEKVDRGLGDLQGWTHMILGIGRSTANRNDECAPDGAPDGSYNFAGRTPPPKMPPQYLKIVEPSRVWQVDGATYESIVAHSDDYVCMSRVLPTYPAEGELWWRESSMHGRRRCAAIPRYDIAQCCEFRYCRLDAMLMTNLTRLTLCCSCLE
jgi:hypothetical protein